MFPWGVDLNQFYPESGQSELREQFGWDDCFVLLSTRSWEHIYDIETLLQSFALAYHNCHNLRLLLIGTGSLAADMNRFIVDNNLQNAVYMPGQVNYADLPAYFRAADLYISCSQSDGTSVSLLEAMASGLPVCVSDIPGNREWVQAGVNGWVVPVGDASGFAGAILEASSATDNIKRMRLNNRKVAESRADWDRNFILLEEAYNKLG
jgi:glycosyltransferase involved in cell wall biosynthesis